MFQFGDQPPNLRVRAVCAAVLALLLSSCGQRTATLPEQTAGTVGVEPGTDLPEVVITAPREKPLRLATKADLRSAPDAK